MYSIHSLFRDESNTLIAKIADDEEATKPMGTEISDLISRFTLNNICGNVYRIINFTGKCYHQICTETAMGVKLNSSAQPDQYRGMIYRCGALHLYRMMNPVLYYDKIFACTWAHR